MKTFNETHLTNLEAQKRNAYAAFLAESDLLTDERGKLADLKSQLRVNFTERPPRATDFPKEFAALSKRVTDAEKKVAAVTKNLAELSRRSTATSGALKSALRHISENRLKPSDGATNADYPFPTIAIGQFEKAIEKAREDIDAAKSRRNAVKTKCVAESVALERLNSEVEKIKSALSEFPLDAFVSRQGSHLGSILTLVDEKFSGAPILSQERALHPFLVAALNLEPARKLYAAKIAEFYKSAGPGLTEAERAAKIATLDGDIRSAEEREEALIRLGEKEFHIFVDRRPDVNAEVLIGPMIILADEVAEESERVTQHPRPVGSRQQRQASPPAYPTGPLVQSWSAP